MHCYAGTSNVDASPYLRTPVHESYIETPTFFPATLSSRLCLVVKPRFFPLKPFQSSTDSSPSGALPAHFVALRQSVLYSPAINVATIPGLYAFFVIFLVYQHWKFWLIWPLCPLAYKVSNCFIACLQSYRRSVFPLRRLLLTDRMFLFSRFGISFVVSWFLALQPCETFKRLDWRL